MSVNWLSLITTIVTLIFAAFVLRRYVRRRGTHLMVWGIGLIMYAIGTFAEFYLSLQWSALWLRLWYICGALLTAAWLGQGTVYLLVRRPPWLANALMAILAAVSVLAVIWTFATPLDASAFSPAVPISEQYRTIFPPGGVRYLTIPLNIYGTITLVGGAIYSAWLFWRKRVLPNRVIGNILIAVGALAPALGGTFTRLGNPQFLYVSELIGAVVMFIGFLTVTSTRATEPGTAQVSAVTR